MPEDIVPIVTAEADEAEGLQQGTALCLSGGGYRAMLFHLGALLYLNEQGWLPKLDRVSSVSGGSITAGVLAMNWAKLNFNQQGVAAAFGAEVVTPVRKLASTTIDRNAILGGIFSDDSIGEKLVQIYQKQLFGKTRLDQLPDKPRFVLNATNVQSGALFRFSKPYIRDYRVGKIDKPKRLLAEAVAASSAFPPVLSPLQLDYGNETWEPNSGSDLQRKPFTSSVVLTDGGVYDNMGIETAWKRYTRILVSDAGGKLQAEESPKDDWVRHSVRVNGLIDNQVRSLRKRQVIASFLRGERQGVYWGIRTNIADYATPQKLPCDFNKTLKLAETPTRLEDMPEDLQEKLINWGYAVCDAGMRTHVDPNLKAPAKFPYPVGIG